MFLHKKDNYGHDCTDRQTNEQTYGQTRWFLYYPPSKQNLSNFVCGGYKYVVAMNKTHDIQNTLTINSFIKNMYQVKGAGQRREEKCLLLQCHVLLMIYLCFTHTFLISM